MTLAKFRFYHPIEVRYGDIDAQRHVNNARYFSYMESSRAAYLKHLGLWDGNDFDHIGIILVETSCQFKRPILFGQAIRVGVRMHRLGQKSLQAEHPFLEAEAGEEVAMGRATLVAYDYAAGSSILIPDDWRRAIETYEQLPSSF